MVSTAIAVVLICFGIWYDFEGCSAERHFPEFSLPRYFVSLGTILFIYGGASTFPTIQVDMNRPSDFTRASWLGFGCTTDKLIYYTYKF
jgi:vesicular inhibitory amino acid transporter